MPLCHIQKVSKIFLLILLTFILLPNSFAAEESDKGTVVVNVFDENTQEFKGDWYLHEGTTKLNRLVRNGSSSETFSVSEGYYFLEVRGKWGDRPYTVLHSDNPQMLNAGETITYNVQYLETEADVVFIMGGTIERPEGTEMLSENRIVIDEFGCNRTEGYVWCEREDTCIRPWYKGCKTGEGTRTVTVSQPVITTPSITRSIDPSRTYLGPQSPYTTATTATSGSSSVQEYQLAETGPSSLAILAITSLLSGLAIRKRRENK